MTEDIAELLSAVPFHQFELTLSDRSSYVVDEPKRLGIPGHGRSVHYHESNGSRTILAVRHIVSVAVKAHAR
ncbi:MAG TPA: hypothetical protein VM597_10825 [Gemmataceae bacterium]|jgi:hypothetical protein|nr:hypothetical protein [Gemmataceae bacterium]